LLKKNLTAKDEFGTAQLEGTVAGVKIYLWKIDHGWFKIKISYFYVKVDHTTYLLP
jgi:hypothetical protein